MTIFEVLAKRKTLRALKINYLQGFVVPGAGIEPARIAPLVFETSASTDSAIRAGVNCFEKCKGIVIFRNCKIIHIGVGIFHTFPRFLWKVPITKAYILSVTPRSLFAYNLPEVSSKMP